MTTISGFSTPCAPVLADICSRKHLRRVCWRVCRKPLAAARPCRPKGRAPRDPSAGGCPLPVDAARDPPAEAAGGRTQLQNRGGGTKTQREHHPVPHEERLRETAGPFQIRSRG